MIGLLIPNELDQHITIEVFHVVGMIAVRLGGAQTTPIEETFALGIRESHFLCVCWEQMRIKVEQMREESILCIQSPARMNTRVTKP